MSEAARDSSVLLSRWVPLLRHEGPDWWERALGPPAADGPGAARDNRRHSSVRCSAPPRPLIYPTAPPHLTSGPAHTTTRQPQTLNALREASFLCRSLQQLRSARRPARRRRGRAGPLLPYETTTAPPGGCVLRLRGYCGACGTAARRPPLGCPPEFIPTRANDSLAREVLAVAARGSTIRSTAVVEIASSECGRGAGGGGRRMGGGKRPMTGGGGVSWAARGGRVVDAHRMCRGRRAGPLVWLTLKHRRADHRPRARPDGEAACLPQSIDGSRGWGRCTRVDGGDGLARGLCGGRTRGGY